MYMKKILGSLLLLLFILLLMVLFLYKDDRDFCLDTGICAENMQLNTEYGLIIINEANCKKYNWKWNSKRHYCNVNKTE